MSAMALYKSSPRVKYILALEGLRGAWVISQEIWTVECWLLKLPLCLKDVGGISKSLQDFSVSWLILKRS